MIDLNSSGAIRSSKSSYKVLGVKAFWIVATVLTVALFVVLVKLGFWQLSRGEEKQHLEQQLLTRDQMPALSIEQVVSFAAQSNVTGYPLTVAVTAQSQPLIYLDNVTHDSKVGYRVLQPMSVSVEGESRLLLVELGFINAAVTRDTLPAVTAINSQEQQTFSGRVYQKSANPLSHDVMAEQMATSIRIQNLNLQQLAVILEKPLLGFVFQPSVIPDSDLPMLWSPYPMTSQKHFGYALQWFSMAIVYAVLVILFVLRKRKVKE
ncbi:SURF1 family protein [Vibrio rarus]|uniref:SURF1 family protein n=1 Tax=Vibrio rarus TaxID=413403 RepID=UPI0021C2CE8E|nr:SURF1 family protein [Vibrio rarus]